MDIELLLVNCVSLGIQIYRAWKDYGKHGPNITSASKEEKMFVNSILPGSGCNANEKLTNIRDDLMKKGDMDSAQKVNELLKEKAKIPEYSFLILKSYLDSDVFYKKHFPSA